MTTSTATAPAPAVEHCTVERGHDGALHSVHLFRADGTVIQIGRGYIWNADSARVAVWEPTSHFDPKNGYDHGTITFFTQADGTAKCYGLVSTRRNEAGRPANVSRATSLITEALPILGLVGWFDSWDGEWFGTQDELQTALLVAFLSD